MKTVAIICEYNPFHNGHKYQIEKIRKSFGENTRIVAIMSGNFVQRGEFAIFEKHTRAEMAINSGVDLVVELPIIHAISSAENFAKGGVLVANELNVDYLCFGSECGDIKLLEEVSRCTLDNDFIEKVKECMKSGISYPLAVSNVLSDIKKEYKEIITNPNNTLGIEYIKSLITLKSHVKPMTILREKVSHNSKSTKENYASASYIRENIKNDIKKFIPNENEHLVKMGNISLINENAILSFLKRKSPEFFKQIPDVSEGLENKIVKELKTATSLDEFYDKTTSKRYTKSRIRRIIINSYLELNKKHQEIGIKYIKTLAFNDVGVSLIREYTSNLPLIIKPSADYKLCEQGEKLMKLDEISTDLYFMSKIDEKLRVSGKEFVISPIKK